MEPFWGEKSLSVPQGQLQKGQGRVACCLAGAQWTFSTHSQQSKMEDRLDEAIHVLRSHAVGTASDLHGLLPGHGALTTSFAGPMPLGVRHAGLVSGGHPEDGLNSGASLLHNHASLPSQPSSLPDLSQRPPDSYSGESQRPGLDHQGKDRILVPRGWKGGSVQLKHSVADPNWTHSGVSLGS